MKIIFVGIQYPLFDNKTESLDVEIFVNSTTRVNKQKTHFFYIDKYLNNSNSKLLSKDLLSYCEEISPDLILFNLINDEIPKSALAFLSKKYKTANWFGDDQWRFESFSINYAKYFNYIITTDKFSIKKYNDHNFFNVILSQWGVVKNKLIKNDSLKYEFDVLFIGNYSLTREWIIDFLKKNGVNVNCYGNGWKNGILSNEEMIQYISLAKINLNLSNSVPSDFNFILHFFLKIFNRKKTPFSYNGFVKFLKALKFYFFYDKNVEQIKARNFEIPYNKGFQISQYAIGIEDYFHIGQEIVVFNNKEELLKLCNYYLDNEDLRIKILNKSIQNSKLHTYDYRFEKILAFIKNDIN